MSQYDKLVKGATKPKPELPKPKYMEPILAAANGRDGALQDVFRALSYRLQDPNSTVAFKTLLVVHTLIRSGASVVVLSYLAGDPSALRLQRVATGGLHESTYSSTLTRYATYLEQRITAFKELGYDLVQASKRDRFARLRKISVSKGLLREIAVLQRLTDALLACSFFAESRQDDLTMSALQMTLKDLLTHYMGMNEGIINMLEHYFDMSRPDAERSLELYKRFCWQTEKVVAFLDAARRLSYRLRAAIPSLKHAPVSLASALEEYLRSGGADAPAAERTRAEAPRKAPDTARDTARDAPAPAAPPAAAPKDASQKALHDFFEALEQPSATSPFQAAYASFANFHAQPDWMHGAQPAWGVAPQATGNPFAPMPTAAGLAPQATGWNPFQASAPLVPQHTMATTPFDQIFGGAGGADAQRAVPGPSGAGALGQPAGGPFGAPSTPFGAQPTGASVPQPTGGPFGTQPTGAFAPQPTGGPFGTQPTGAFAPQPTGGPFGTQPTGAFAPQPSPFGTQPTGAFAPQPTGGPFGTQPTGASAPQPSPFGTHPSPFAPQPTGPPSSGGIPPAIAQRLQAQRTASAPVSPQSTPAAAPAKASSPPAAAPSKDDTSTSRAHLKPHKTGSMNPFSIPSDFEEPAPPQPKPPSLAELASQSWLGTGKPLVQEPTSMREPVAPQPTGLMSSIASEFARPAAGGSQAPHSASGAEPSGAPRSDAPPDPWARPPAPQRTGTDAAGPWSAASPGAGAPHGPRPSIWGNVSPAWDTQPRAGEAQRASSVDVSSAPLDAQRTGAPTLPFPAFGATFSPSGRSHTGLGISSHAADGAGARSDALSSAAGGTPSFGGAGFATPMSTPGMSSPTFPNPHQPTGLASQPTGFAGIKPFQPTSSFGHSLLKQHGQAPDAPAPSAPAATQDLLQL
ncbi:hypothetical protein MBRA1_003888 [Malassezia brasiliensis]|uniref:ENTH domain-containing protein n=1 Tax=Malassezia brasiliensis TaxID=1821822 RepID=A0AAF0DXI7_9BASI|nr:hypothetical protein MBRA1_003888 [Malassezia brasiliensis]